ncbi:MAG: hypothetical protein ACE37F_12590 [Nannocystaceae bacterium]|nr:hypothetical protein [bacterium]
MLTPLWCLAMFIVCGERRDRDEAPGSVLDDAGMFHPYPVRYDLHVEGNAAIVTINEEAEVVICDTFSENCAFEDLPVPLPRLRHHESSVELTPYLRRGANAIRIQVRPDGEDDAPLRYRLVRSQDGKKRKTLAEGEVELAELEGASLAVETSDQCTPPLLPNADWVTKFLAPYPESTMTRTAESAAKLLPPPRTEKERERRAAKFERRRALSLNEYPFPKSAVVQTPESGPLALNYSCENERLFVHPVDGAYLFAAVIIERHPEGPLKGAMTKSILGTAAALGYWDNQWYVAEFL